MRINDLREKIKDFNRNLKKGFNQLEPSEIERIIDIMSNIQKEPVEKKQNQENESSIEPQELLTINEAAAYLKWASTVPVMVRLVTVFNSSEVSADFKLPAVTSIVFEIWA